MPLAPGGQDEWYMYHTCPASETFHPIIQNYLLLTMTAHNTIF